MRARRRWTGCAHGDVEPPVCALAALHAARKIGLVYRDAKLSDILVDEDDFAYLIDFGIALDAASTRVTKSGA
jgi:serine/threonine protein kinase